MLQFAPMNALCVTMLCPCNQSLLQPPCCMCCTYACQNVCVHVHNAQQQHASSASVCVCIFNNISLFETTTRIHIDVFIWSRYDWGGIANNPYYDQDTLPLITPNFDELGRSGVRFTRAFVGAPVCAPSRACLASGRQ